MTQTTERIVTLFARQPSLSPKNTRCLAALLKAAPDDYLAYLMVCRVRHAWRIAQDVLRQRDMNAA